MILIFEQDLTHYRALFYEYLAGFLDEKLLIVYGKGEPSAFHILEEISPQRTFKTQEIYRRWIGRFVYFNSFRDIRAIAKDNNITCVIHRGAIRNFGLYREIRFFKKKGIPVVLRGIGFSTKRNFDPKINLADKYHQFIINACDAYLCYTEGSKKKLDKFYDPTKIFVAVNTLNSDLMEDHFCQLEKIGKASIKDELGLKCDKYIIHVGRMSPRKKVKDLVDIYAKVKTDKESIGLILVGDGEERLKLQEYIGNNDIQDVLFTGAISSENILVSKYLYISDVFLITGNIGLSVNHAFFFGVPVVGFIAKEEMNKPSGYVLTPEHEYLIDGYNGVVVKNYNLNDFSTAVKNVLGASELSENAHNYAQTYLTVEAMAKGYLAAINYVKHKMRGTLK